MIKVNLENVIPNFRFEAINILTDKTISIFKCKQLAIHDSREQEKIKLLNDAVRGDNLQPPHTHKATAVVG